MSVTVPSSSGFPDYYRTLSLKLYQVLEDIGASLEMRETYMEASTCFDSLSTLIFQDLAHVYTFGSMYEGSTTRDMYSDADHVIVDDTLPVVCDISNTPNGKCLAVVQDENVHPGYTKLQLVEDRVPLFQRDTVSPGFMLRRVPVFVKFGLDKNRRVSCLFRLPSFMIESGGVDERHGPAMTKNARPQVSAEDTVYALKCLQWPDCALEWLERERANNWPPQSVIEVCKTQRFLLVPIGHPNSDEWEFQWRLSFSHQEKQLISIFNSTQLKCFIILKLLKKEFIHPSLSESSLKSYHIKTCMLYLTENTRPDFWRPDNLLCCIVTCLRLLFTWCYTGICPNYFIPSENMFDGLTCRQAGLRERLCEVLMLLLSADCKYLISIQSDLIGRRLAHSCTSALQYFGPGQEWILVIRKRMQKLDKIFTVVLTALYIRNKIFNAQLNEMSSHKSLASFVERLYLLKVHLRDMHRSTEHMGMLPGQISCSSLICPHIEVCLISNVLALVAQQEESASQIWSYLASDRWYQLSLDGDVFSPRLKQACFHHMLGHYHSSLDILSSIENQVRLSICRCDEDKFVTPDALELLSRPSGGNVVEEVERLMKNTLSPCVVFLPTEKDITPPALVYEMTRSEGSSSGIRCELFYFWYNWAVVDGTFLLHFLLYLNHRELRMEANLIADIHNMIRLLGSKKISHLETACNLLGWVCKEQGLLDAAFELFKKSLEIKPQHNAAFRHIRDIEHYHGE